MIRRLLWMSALVCAIAVPAVAAPPNLSGTWKINRQKSDFGQFPAPEKMERTIVHNDPALSFTTNQSGPQGDVTSEMKYTTDGKPSSNRTPRGEVTGAASWDGNALVITSKREMNGMSIQQVERWTLSADNNTLTIINKISGTPMGDLEMRVVLERAGAEPPKAAASGRKLAGDWKLNAGKSDFGPMPAPESGSLNVAMQDPEIKVVMTQASGQGEMKFDLTFNTEGKETANKMGPMEMKSTAKWDGDVLVVSSKLDFNGMDIVSADRWTVSPDGKVLTLARHATTPQGEMDMKLVYDRQ